MQINSFKFFLLNYWRDIDKKILIYFFILFFLGLFFSFSSTSSLAGERLNKDYYFFFIKHLIFTFLALGIMILISFIKTELLIRLVLPLFTASFILLALVGGMTFYMLYLQDEIWHVAELSRLITLIMCILIYVSIFFYLVSMFITSRVLRPAVPLLTIILRN